jgi:adenylyltransferase/sulfurtransferase
MVEAKNGEDLSHDEYKRYTRQLIMKDIGLPGQKKLKAARVLIIGAGGLGSPATLYLSGAGVGTIGLVDGDVVDESNLHRQVIHSESTLNMHKVESAK